MFLPLRSPRPSLPWLLLFHPSTEHIVHLGPGLLLPFFPTVLYSLFSDQSSLLLTTMFPLKPSPSTCNEPILSISPLPLQILPVQLPTQTVLTSVTASASNLQAPAVIPWVCISLGSLGCSYGAGVPYRLEKHHVRLQCCVLCSIMEHSLHKHFTSVWQQGKVPIVGVPLAY